MLDPRNPDLAKGKVIHGFEVLSGSEAPNIRAVSWELRHRETGAHHLHISHELEENVFITCLRTLPQDDTGVAHILEHSVLEGSRSFPVKMFNQLTGRSLNSFLNAFTSPDRTAYPFATPNAEDWDNLLVRYLDAVFHPLLEDEAFLQEGWRLEFRDARDPAAPLEIRGVVYNEMKAALSSPEAQFARRFRRELLPDLSYAHESGGDPEAIPDLSIEAWRAFHSRHYHPANSWSATFGCFPLAPSLRRMDEAFRGMGRGEALRQGPQPPLGSPRQISAHYPTVGHGGTEHAPRFAALGWRLCPQTDLHEAIRLSFLFEVLCGGLAAPLNHALLQSGLGPALAPVSFDGSLSQLIFGIGLKEVAEGAGPQVARVVLETLERLARDGLDPTELQTALDRFELENREQSRVWGMPWGLTLAYFGMPHWMAGGDVHAGLRNDLLLEQLRREAADPDFLPGLIRRWLLENPERLLLELSPQPGAMEERERALAARLAGIHDGMTAAARDLVLGQAARVAAWRADEGDLRCMPELDPARLPRAFTTWPFTTQACAGGQLQLHDQPVNGLSHLKLALPLSAMDPDLDLVDLLGWITRMSHAGLGTEASERRLRSLTGGVALGSHHSMAATGAAAVHRLFVSFHGLSGRAGDWLAMCEDLLSRPDLQDSRRLGELLRMRQAGLRSQVIGSAAQIALQTAQDSLSPIGLAMDRAEGLAFLRALDRMEVERDRLGERLAALLERILSTGGRLVSLCAEAGTFGETVGMLDRTLARLSPVAGQVDSGTVGPLAGDAGPVRACLTEVDGAFIAESWTAPDYGNPDAARLVLLSTWMVLPLYERIRAAGGAYGAMASYDWGQRTFSFLSWRDPRICGTYRDFDAVRERALAGEFTLDELKRAKVEALRRLDTPLLPHERASRCFQHTLLGAGLELRNAHRRTLLDATAADLAEAAGRWLGGSERRRVVVCPEGMLTPERLEDLDLSREEILPSRGRE